MVEKGLYPVFSLICSCTLIAYIQFIANNMDPDQTALLGKDLHLRKSYIILKMHRTTLRAKNCENDDIQMQCTCHQLFASDVWQLDHVKRLKIGWKLLVINTQKR